ncbi:hypothetical protein BACCAP_01355 [Pseudoflavonifractor capillosus ATCC 29799]|uniref:Uncharacterized protein n=1 Tax=Pseudoflavonifractor capillosus ATCC 29799 TaxID=411467 RepID=A6NT26_9FIRM|nr:hypothetical protein BACCAP_01355 [Pseudoflavonifractor capillosus ATCC 29799]
MIPDRLKPLWTYHIMPDAQVKGFAKKFLYCQKYF